MIRTTCTIAETITGQLTPPRHVSGSSTISSICSSKIPRQKPRLRTFLPRNRYTPIMSEVIVPPPQYTPPPPPPAPRPQYDFLKPLAFVFEDPNWIGKLLMGALFSLAAVVLIGVFFLYGYLARLVR